MTANPAATRGPGRATTEDLFREVRALFRPPPRTAHPPRVGLEAEFIPVRAGTGRAVLPADGDDEGEGTLPVLRRHARAHGWRAREVGTGLPVFDLPDGSRVSYEPGGQIEYATTPASRLGPLEASLSACLLPLAAALHDAGIRMLARGLDPVTPPSQVRRILEGERYPRQEAHYARRGPAGRTMMLQTAGIHVNVDPGPRPVAAWNRANTMVPHLIALFANAPLSETDPSGPARSARAGLWRVLDPTRNTVFAPSDAPWEGYAQFALGAESFLLGEPERPPRTFARWLGAGVSLDAIRAHLTTLFPEVRPRGYLEIRSVDAVPLRWCVVPAALGLAVALTGSGGAGASCPVFPDLPPASEARLVGAGRAGLAHPGLAEECRRLRDWVMTTLEGAGDAVAGPAVLRTVDDFFRWGLERGRDPGRAVESWLES